MNPIHTLARGTVVGAVVGRVRAWPVNSQLGARRNAMVASTALAARRAERDDVESFLAGLAPRERVLRVSVAGRR